MIPARYSIFFICSLLLFGCGSKTPVGFSNTEELKTAYQKAYEGGDLESILAMVYWDDTPEGIKQLYNTVVSIGLGRHKFDKLEVVPLDRIPHPENFIEREIEPTLVPTHWLVGNHSGNTGFNNSKATGTIQFAIGSVEGQFFIAGIRYKK